MSLYRCGERTLLFLLSTYLHKAFSELLIEGNVDERIVCDGRLGEEGRDDGLSYADVLRVSKRGPQGHHSIGRPGEQEGCAHDDGHQHDLLLSTNTYEKDIFGDSNLDNTEL